VSSWDSLQVEKCLSRAAAGDVPWRLSKNRVAEIGQRGNFRELPGAYILLRDNIYAKLA
jgi:hypothetical protein